MIRPKFKDSEAKKEKCKAFFDIIDVDHSVTYDVAVFRQAIFRLNIKLAGDFLESNMGPMKYFKHMTDQE